MCFSSGEKNIPKIPPFVNSKAKHSSEREMIGDRVHSVLMNDMLSAEADNMEQLLADSCLERAVIEARPIDAQAQARNTVANGLSTHAEEEERARERANKREMCFV